MKPFRELGSIVVVTLLAHLVGSAILAGVTGGPPMVLAAPFIALFGWFLLIPEFAIVTLQWELAKRNKFSSSHAWLISVFAVCIAFTCFAPKEEGSYTQWAIAYAFGSLIAFSLSFAIIQFHHNSEKRSATERSSADLSLIHI